MNQKQADRVAWACFDDTIRRLLPSLNVQALTAVVFDLRAAPGAVWGTLTGDLANARDLLRLAIIDRAEELLDGPWPFLEDAPVCPDNLSALFAADAGTDIE
jgi:hypothetical protein